MKNAHLSPVTWLLAGIAALSIATPIGALLLRADWATFPADVGTGVALDALRLSFLTAGIATVICLALGVPLALYLASSTGWAGKAVRVLVNLPLVMPPLVAGLALLMLFGRNGVLGRPLAELTGLSLPFTTPAVVVAQVFVSLPFMVITVEGVLRTVNPDYVQTASSLGAPPRTVFWQIIAPLAMPGIVAGTMLTFARALGEFGATILFAGNRQGVTQTMPLAIYTAFSGGGVSGSSAVALSITLLVAAFAVIFLTRTWTGKRQSLYEAVGDVN